MVMDPRFNEFSDSINGFKFDDDAFFPTSDPSEDLANKFSFKDETVDFNFMDSPFLLTDPSHGFVAQTSSATAEVESPDDSDFNDNVLKYINSILMEENMEQKPSMFHDPLALQAAEKSLYDVIGEKYPSSANQSPIYVNHLVDSPDNLFGSSSEQSTSNTSGSNSIDSQWIVDLGEHKPSAESDPFRYPLETTLQTTSQWSFEPMKSFNNNVNDPLGSSMSGHLFPNIFSDTHSILQFKRGVEEASKFLPKNDQLVIDLKSYPLPPASNDGAQEVVVKVEKGVRENSPNGTRGKKNHREDTDLEEQRSSKQSAVYADEPELSEMFDRVLLFTDVKGEPACCDVDKEVQSGGSEGSQHNGQPDGSSDGKTRAKKRGSKNEAVDLRTLLITCAHSVASDDRRTAYQQLSQIRQHCSPLGDGSERVAKIFADGLEARLAGTGSQIYRALAAKKISAAEKLKAYQLYLSACPFKMVAILFSNKMIVDVAMKSSKKKLHIIDFGILYGFQWPILIKILSNLPGGPPELRITGIELPRPGFRPAEFVEETGHRLANYCERFNVKFRYHAIAQKWETIKIKDLNICSDEVLAVNTLFRFTNLHDETVAVDSPRDAVLKLIRKMNPDIFVQSVSNGSYNSPFFVTRFREALFHYSSLFDMFETKICREDQGRMNFEKEFYGREVMNIIACEGSERVERPETYKQWQVRTMRAGFRIFPLKKELVNKLKDKVKIGYPKDFVFDEDGQWLLQGWKGRILCATSCWAPDSNL
ncbi:scarecrow-like protein 33 [Diospyros lotus]|uniref:scarecrow-like protein 33 n=1 Tax=Diospyros lotus TaxID=55363 RepID=UPI0022569782|nr:scarecrow-like protein 33 [Diospyros lotus]